MSPLTTPTQQQQEAANKAATRLYVQTKGKATQEQGYNAAYAAARQAGANTRQAQQAADTATSEYNRPTR